MSDKYGEDKPWYLTQEPDEAPSYDDLTDRIEELEERLKAATDDAKEAEAYAEKLEERIEHLLEQRNFTQRQVVAAEAKLAKAVEALEKISKYDHQKTAINALKYQPVHHPVAAIDTLRESLAVIASTDMKAWVNNTLAEIKGEK